MTRTLEEIDIATALSRGFSAGNYSNAYETQDLAQAMRRRLSGEATTLSVHASTAEHLAYKAGFILGFFSSYELSEIPGAHREAFDAAYHSAHGRAVLAAGYCDSRAADYAAEAAVRP